MEGSCIFIVVFSVVPQMEDAAVLSAGLYIHQHHLLHGW